MPKKKSARVPVCRVHVSNNLGFSVWYYVPGTTYVRTWYQLVISWLPRYVYVDTYVPGWGTYYVPHMFLNWCEHVFLYLVSAGSQDTYTWYVGTCVPGLHLPPQTKNRRPRTGSGSDTRTARQSLHSEVRVTTSASVTEGVAAVSWI